MMNRLRRTLLASALLGALIVIPRTPAFAGQAVDTSTLNPVPASDYSCQSSGANVICQVTRISSSGIVLASDFEDAPFVCAGQPIYESVQETNTFTRFYTYESAGYNGPGYYLTRRIGHDTGVKTMSPSPTLAAPAVSWTFHLNSHTVLATPGDLSTATTNYDGLDAMANAPGFGLLFHQSGSATFDGNDELVSFHGPRDLDVDFWNSLGRLCAALGAP